MKTIRCFLFILIVSLLSHSVLSQSKNYDSESRGSGATIVGISGHGAFDTGYRYVPAGVFSIDVKNTGTKTITAIRWEFFLVDTVRGDAVYDHFKFFTDDKKIQPGETKRLTKRFGYGTIPDYIG